MRIQRISVETPAHSCFVEITAKVQTIVHQSEIEDGIALIFVPHTTAGITLNENADPNVVRDMLTDLDRIAPDDQSYYRHFEGNSASHLKTSFVGNNLVIFIEGGNIVLGRWQGIYLCEFDGPRTRRVQIKIIPDME
jgi:secondary thiamine-phosphate synthase enzyme